MKLEKQHGSCEDRRVYADHSNPGNKLSPDERQQILDTVNEKRFARDKKFWDDQLDALGEPLYSDIQGPSVLEEARKKHKNKKLRAALIKAGIKKKNIKKVKF